MTLNTPLDPFTACMVWATTLFSGSSEEETSGLNMISKSTSVPVAFEILGVEALKN